MMFALVGRCRIVASFVVFETRVRRRNYLNINMHTQTTSAQEQQQRRCAICSTTTRRRERRRATTLVTRGLTRRGFAVHA